MSYVYRSFERGLWTVGFYDPDDQFVPESDWPADHEAADRVAYLNGSPTRTVVAELIRAHVENDPHIYADGSTA